MSIKVLDKSGSTPQEVLLAGVSPVDAILNNSSTNAIQNKAVYNALKEKVEKTVTDLVNYYDKSQVYNKTETRAMVDAISTMTIEVVTALPTTDISTTTIYFLRQGSTNVYDQYVYVNGAWVKIGDTTVDLSQYLTIANFNIAIADYYTKSEIDTLLANVDIDVDSALDSVSENPVQNKVLKTEFDKKADKVTSATNGNVATLNASGNLLDGGKALSALPTTFIGTTAAWNALSVADKAKYQLVNLTDDGETGDIVDAVTDGDLRPVTSNAVYDFIHVDVYSITTNSNGYWKTPFHVNEATILRAEAIDRHVFPFVGSDKYWYVTVSNWTSPGTNLVNSSAVIDLVYFYKTRNV